MNHTVKRASIEDGLGETEPQPLVEIKRGHVDLERVGERRARLPGSSRQGRLRGALVLLNSVGRVAGTRLDAVIRAEQDLLLVHVRHVFKGAHEVANGCVGPGGDIVVVAVFVFVDESGVGLLDDFNGFGVGERVVGDFLGIGVGLDAASGGNGDLDLNF